MGREESRYPLHWGNRYKCVTLQPTSNPKNSWCWTSITPISGLAGVLSILGLVQFIDGEVVGCCPAHSDTINTVHRISTVWPHPLQGAIEFSHGKCDSTYEGIGLSSYWTSSYSGDRDLELRGYEERKKGVNKVFTKYNKGTSLMNPIVWHSASAI